MKHAKRMLLVPEDVLARLERKQKQEMSPLVTNLMNVNENMEEILRRMDINDGEKQIVLCKLRTLYELKAPEK